MVNYESLIKKIKSEIKKTDKPAIGLYRDLYSVIREAEDSYYEYSHEQCRELKGMVQKRIKGAGSDEVEELFEIYRACLLYDAPLSFDSYLLYLEIDRPAKERFYQPRRKQLKILVNALQDLADDRLDELFLSCPPRIGKTSILMFYATWILGRHPEQANLYSAYSDTITKAFYNGIMEILKDGITYHWKDVFPDRRIASTNAADETINIDRRKRYPSITCRSLYGTLNGACDCNGILMSDDLIGGIEEAVNKDRLKHAWDKVDNNLIPRAKENAKILWCGTRWSMIDPAGLRMELLENDERYKYRRYRIINIPALNEKDESNFDYDYGVGFSTDYYQQRRASFERNNDAPSWLAQYMGEPIEREGTVFSPSEFRYYNGVLPDTEPDRIFMAVDPAFGGGDFVAAPVCYQYDEDIYIADVVYNNGDKRVTQPLIVSKIKKHGIQAVQIESSKSTEGYKEGIEELLRAEGIRVNMTMKSANGQNGKQQRIFDKAPDIRESMVFIESGKRSKDYSLFMQNVFSFKMFGKNKHDDAPDSLAMVCEMIHAPSRRVEIFKRPF